MPSRSPPRARDLATRLELPNEEVKALAAAARMHDDGKAAARWQNAMNAPQDDGRPYAKTRGGGNWRLLEGYRHEFGSLLKADKLENLPESTRDLILHLIAAHHGRARPLIPTEGCEDGPPSQLESKAGRSGVALCPIARVLRPLGARMAGGHSQGGRIRAYPESGRKNKWTPGKMAESSIPVDLLNPGQVFACLGILEITDVLLGDAKGAFDWRREQATVFRVSAAKSKPPVQSVMRFLKEARIDARAPVGSTYRDVWKASWGEIPEINDPGAPFPFPDPKKPAKLPVVLRDDIGNEATLDYWGDATRRDNVKFWAGAGGKPGVAILRDALESVRGTLAQHEKDPFALSEPQTISFPLRLATRLHPRSGRLLPERALKDRDGWISACGNPCGFWYEPRPTLTKVQA